MAALHTCSTTKKNEFLQGYTNAYLAWDTLKSRHEKVGPIAQILLIQQALAVKYVRSECLSTTSTTLHDLVRRIYTIGIPKEEDFLTIMMLNTMAEDLPHVHNHIVDALTTSTASKPYGPTHICSCLDVEQQLLDTAKSKGTNVALAATSRGGNSRDNCKCCGTCGNSSHLTKDYFGKGGAMEGKWDEVLAQKCAACDSKAPAGKSKPTAATSTLRPSSESFLTPGRMTIPLFLHPLILSPPALTGAATLVL